MSIISVIPWSIPFLKAIPGSGNAFNKFKHIANNYASHRATVGSQSKDLWYRLVSRTPHLYSVKNTHPIFDPCSQANATIMRATNAIDTRLQTLSQL